MPIESLSDITRGATSAFESGGGGGGANPPAGADRAVQFNNGGAPGGASRVAIGASGNLVLTENTAQPPLPPAGTTGVYIRDRAGQGMLEVQRDTGREIPMQESFALNRVGRWSPSATSAVNTDGMPRVAVGTVTTPSIAATNFSTSVRRWRLQSSVTANASAEERAGQSMVGRGNANYPGGWFFVTRVSLAALQATSVGFFGMTVLTTAFATTTAISALTNIVGFGFTNGTDANWQCLRNDASGSPTAIDMGPDFPVNNLTNVYSLFVASGVRASSIWVRAVNEVTGAVFETELSTDIPANTTFLSPRQYLHNGGVAAAVAYECSGVYLSSDF
jgi:hypothetical protein